jgi:hypothetical protein
MSVVQIGNRSTETFDTGSRSILSPCHGNINLLGTLERALDIILDFWSSLSQVCPLLWFVEEAMFVCPLCTPDDTCGGTCRIETGVRSVAFVGISELTMNLGVCLWIGLFSILLRKGSFEGNVWKKASLKVATALFQVRRKTLILASEI